jgi:hypothetical protein
LSFLGFRKKKGFPRFDFSASLEGQAQRHSRPDFLLGKVKGPRAFLASCSDREINQKAIAVINLMLITHSSTSIDEMRIDYRR